MTEPLLCASLGPASRPTDWHLPGCKGARIRRWMPVLAVLLAGCASSPGRLQDAEPPARSGRSVVTGVDAGDVLKLRAGAGTGYRILVGLPNGAVVIDRGGCTRVGGTPWCDVSPAEAPQLRGFVSGHYLKPR